MKKKAIIIGGGIHGITSAIALSENGLDVTIIDKQQGILQATSGATHNRAHLGYHYPKSIKTAIECLKGFKYFKNKYPEALYYPQEAYYVIAKKSSDTSGEEFKKFCEEIDIPYKIQWPSVALLKREPIDCSFLVPEPVFNLNILSGLLEKELLDKAIPIEKNTEVIRGEKLSDNGFKIIVETNNGRKDFSADIVINATYSHTNKILKIFNVEEDMTEYCLQKTEVVVAKTKRDIPALTVMDGPFQSIMPYAGHDKHLLVYDVIYSVVHEERGYFCDDSKVFDSNWSKMIEHGKEYFPFIEELEYVCSLWGHRPIRLGDTERSRCTRLKAHKNTPGFYSILEGKFISAPLMAEEIVNMLREREFIQ